MMPPNNWFFLCTTRQLMNPSHENVLLYQDIHTSLHHYISKTYTHHYIYISYAMFNPIWFSAHHIMPFRCTKSSRKLQYRGYIDLPDVGVVHPKPYPCPAMLVPTEEPMCECFIIELLAERVIDKGVG
ncbi:hypothetical protein VPH35_057869 [Triticum aestivum]|uniref:Uncharacterized protein n=1 Tax=Aegilops tauschii subsp. strangulata TaxID=200361 RepID=A0A453DX48_AEGTS